MYVMKYKFFSFVLALCLLFSNTVFATISSEQTTQKSTQTDELQLTAEAAILMDATSGQILYEKNSDTKQYPASITKLMTILLALEKMEAENISLTDTITFSHDAIYTIEPGSSHIAIQEGETLTLQQVLYGIILQSANECSNGIAEFVDGSTESFAKHMTARAKELGCQNTNFVNANGLFDKEHYTTAHDMALITKQLLTHDTYRKLVEKTYFEIPPTNKQSETRYLHGQHQMLNNHSLYYYPEAKGGKTGFTNEALNTLVTFAKKGDTELIVVVLKCAGAQHYVDTKTLFDYGFENYKTIKAVSRTDIKQNVAVTETLQNKTSTKQTISAILEQDIYVAIPKQSSVADIQQTITCNDTVSVPIVKGDILGTLTLTYDGKPITHANLVASDDVAETTKEELAKMSAQKRSHMFKTIALVVIGILLLLLFAYFAYRYMLYQIQERKRAKRKAARKRRLQQAAYHEKQK